LVAVQGIQLRMDPPLPEKPNQRSRVCDELSPTNEGCWAGNDVTANNIKSFKDT